MPRRELFRRAVGVHKPGPGDFFQELPPGEFVPNADSGGYRGVFPRLQLNPAAEQSPETQHMLKRTLAGIDQNYERSRIMKDLLARHKTTQTRYAQPRE